MEQTHVVRIKNIRPLLYTDSIENKPVIIELETTLPSDVATEYIGRPTCSKNFRKALLICTQCKNYKEINEKVKSEEVLLSFTTDDQYNFSALVIPPCEEYPNGALYSFDIDTIIEKEEK